jgi:hypothetical protein
MRDASDMGRDGLNGKSRCLELEQRVQWNWSRAEVVRTGKLSLLERRKGYGSLKEGHK